MTSDPRALAERLRKLNRCRRCDCRDCGRDPAGDMHGHICTGGPNCVDTVPKLRAAITKRNLLAAQAADALTVSVNDEMLEALRPFARIEYRPEFPDDYIAPTGRPVPEANDDEPTFTVGDLRRARTAITKAQFAKGREWQPIESAPKDGTPLLLFARHVEATAPIIVIGWLCPGIGWIASSFAGQSVARLVPSHWMPRPNFPTAVSDVESAKAQQSPPKGWKLVPEEPSEEMLAEGDSAIPRFEAELDGSRLMGREGALACYRAMLAAAPLPTPSQPEENAP